MSTRRAILGLIGTAPIAAGAAKAEIAAAISNAPNLNAAVQAREVASSTLGQIGRNPVREMYEKLRRRHSQEQEVRRSLRYSSGGLDPDIRALRSVSDGYRMQKQLERDLETEDMLERLQQMIWGRE